MTLFPQIIVLEGTCARVAWLRTTFHNTEIVHCTNVVDFLKAIRTPHALVILDHDLAGDLGDSPEAKAIYEAGETGDAYGLTGMDAARAVDVNTPVVVWSANPVWGPRMGFFLVGRGVCYVNRQPFTADGRMANTIRHAYFSSTGVWLSGRHADAQRVVKND